MLKQVLSLAARTAGSESLTYKNLDCYRSVTMLVNITAISGTATIQPQLYAVDNNGNEYAMHAAPTALDATGVFAFVIGPGCAGAAGGDVKATYEVPVPSQWKVKVTHGNGDSVTYSVDVMCGY